MKTNDSSESLRVFIIEDDQDARETLVDILELDDYEVKAFPNADAALKADQLALADVVLLDRKLPDGLAEQLLPNLREMAPNASFIVITGHADMAAAIAALREGVSDFLIKPIDPGALRAGLARLAKNLATERELYRQRRFAEKLLETAEAIVLVLDPQGSVIRANPYLLETTGYQLEEVIGADWFEVFIPERCRAEIRNVFLQTVNQMKTRGILNPIVAKDGRECEIRWSNSTLRDENGVTTAVLAVGLDVTDFVAAQGKVLQNERLAAIGETVTGLAHESRNALQRMQNAVDLLQKQFQDDEQVLKDIAKIERAGSHIRDLLEEVRAYAAPISLCRTTRTLPHIWRRAWETLEHRVARMDFVLHESLVDARLEQMGIWLDERRMEQVFRNLFENAFDAAISAGETSLQVSISAQLHENTIDIVVRDNGPGIPVTHREKLFDAFSTSKPTGTGLGLAICRRIIEAHEGTIVLKEFQEGAEFEIQMPLRPPPEKCDATELVAS